MGGSRDLHWSGWGGVGSAQFQWNVISMTCGSCEGENLVLALHELEDCSSHWVENLVLALHELEVVKIGNFKLNNDLAHVCGLEKWKLRGHRRRLQKGRSLFSIFYYCILIVFLCCRQATCLLQERCKVSQLREREKEKIKHSFVRCQWIFGVLRVFWLYHNMTMCNGDVFKRVI